jgi:hypothetical protein
MTTKDTVDELKYIFGEMLKVLENENESKWVRGIQSIRGRLELMEQSADKEQALKEIATSYRNMNYGPGSFADFMIWRDDFEERTKLNEGFEKLADRAWELLKLK